MAGNNLVHNAEVKDKKCATCRHYEPSPLRKRGWCRNPLLYDRNTNHLVEEDTLGCSRGFGSVNYWEPLVLQSGRPALTRREKEQAREREQALSEQNGSVATAPLSATPGEATMLGPSQAEFASMKAGVDADPRATSMLPLNDGGAVRAASRLRFDTAPAVLRPAGSPAPSPNDISPNRPRLRGGRPRKAIPATTPTEVENAARTVPAVPLTRMEKFKVFILARPWLPVLLVLLIALGGGGAWYVKTHGLPSFKLGPIAFGPQATSTATAAPTALPTLVLVTTPTPAQLPSPPPGSAAPTPPPNILAVGGYAMVSGASALNVRNQPTTSGVVVDTLVSGAVVHIIGGPKQGGGLDWWQVDSWPNSNGKNGWCAAKFLKPTAKP
jgi:Bacterial SH3 domain